MSADETWFVRADDAVRLHVTASGPADGRKIVLLHGFPDSSEGWREQVAPLAHAGFRVIVPDLRGYGRSDCPRGIDVYTLTRLVADVLAVGGAGRFDLVGHDWGGIIAFAVAAWHPDRIRVLTILNAPHLDAVAGVLRRDRAQIRRSAYVAFFQLTGIAEVLLRRRDFRLLKAMLRFTALSDTFADQEVASFCRDWARPGQLTAMLNYYRALVRRSRAPLGRVTMPTQILWGMHDPALGYGLAEASLALCDDGRLTRFDQASHWPQRDQSAVVSAAIASFHHSRV